MRLRAVVCASVIALFGVGVAVADPHESHDSKKKKDHYSHDDQSSHEDHGRHLAKGHHKFDDRDREITHAWCNEHRDRPPVGFREVDRLPPQLEIQLKVGAILPLDLRKHIVPMPTDLLHRLPAPPVDVQYVAIGGHVALMDQAHRLHDLLPLPPLPF
jgi:Ni/Co efflux regulator RcnB